MVYCYLVLLLCFGKMEEELERYLREERQIDDATIHEMKKEKVNMATIRLMDEKALSQFLCFAGDRYSVKNFCQRGNACSTKETFALKLKRKLCQMGRDNKNEVPSLPSTSGEGLKPTRKVTIGWICDGSHIRTSKGGGIREVDVLKTHKKADLLKIALNLFFPSGSSTRGSLNAFTYDLHDYKCHSFDDTLTVENIFKITGLTRIRFYLVTNSLIDKEESPKGKGKTKGKSKGKNKNTSSKKAKPTQVISTSSDEEPSRDVNVKEANTTLKITSNNEPDKTEHKEIEERSRKLTNDLEEFLLFDDTTELLYGHEDRFPSAVVSTNADNLTYEIYEEENFSILPYIQPPTTYKICLHRGHVFNELIEEFLKIDNLENIGTLEIEMYSFNGVKEAAFDAGGVLKDTLSEFWFTFYEWCCEGTSYKVPVIRHDFDEAKWQAIAKICILGYQQVKYFPCKIVRPFMEQVIFGVYKTDLVESLLLCISENDSHLLKSALKDFDSVEKDDLLDILNNLDCKKNPTEQTLPRIVSEISHTQIIQKSLFVIEAWRHVMKNKFDEETLETIYVKNKITNKNVINMIKYEALSGKQNDVISYLKKYVREMNLELLEKFLRFCTGANLIADSKISVSFNLKTGLARRPESRTCSCQLEISETYESYTEFKSEFNSILSSNEWQMDGV